jgi:hypothetical protein
MPGAAHGQRDARARVLARGRSARRLPRLVGRRGPPDPASPRAKALRAGEIRRKWHAGGRVPPRDRAHPLQRLLARDGRRVRGLSPGLRRVRVLCEHRSSSHVEKVHVHPSFSPDSGPDHTTPGRPLEPVPHLHRRKVRQVPADELDPLLDARGRAQRILRRSSSRGTMRKPAGLRVTISGERRSLRTARCQDFRSLVRAIPQAATALDVSPAGLPIFDLSS